jgi:hypothetical protein
MVTTKTTTKTEVPEMIQTLSDQLLVTVKEYQKFSLDATKSMMKVVSALPVVDLPTTAKFADVPSAEAVTNYTFNLVNDLLGAQRDFALQLATVLTPQKLA